MNVYFLHKIIILWLWNQKFSFSSSSGVIICSWPHRSQWVCISIRWADFEFDWHRHRYRCWSSCYRCWKKQLNEGWANGFDWVSSRLPVRSREGKGTDGSLAAHLGWPPRPPDESIAPASLQEAARRRVLRQVESLHKLSASEQNCTSMGKKMNGLTNWIDPSVDPPIDRFCRRKALPPGGWAQLGLRCLQNPTFPAMRMDPHAPQRRKLAHRDLLARSPSARPSRMSSSGWRSQARRGEGFTYFLPSFLPSRTDLQHPQPTTGRGTRPKEQNHSSAFRDLGALAPKRVRCRPHTYGTSQRSRRTEASSLGSCQLLGPRRGTRCSWIGSLIGSCDGLAFSNGPTMFSHSGQTYNKQSGNLNQMNTLEETNK